MSCYSSRKNVKKELRAIHVFALSLSLTPWFSFTKIHIHIHIQSLDNFVWWKLLRGVNYELWTRENGRFSFDYVSLPLFNYISTRFIFMRSEQQQKPKQQPSKCRLNAYNVRFSMRLSVATAIFFNRLYAIRCEHSIDIVHKRCVLYIEIQSPRTKENDLNYGYCV